MFKFFSNSNHSVRTRVSFIEHVLPVTAIVVLVENRSVDKTFCFAARVGWEDFSRPLLIKGFLALTSARTASQSFLSCKRIVQVLLHSLCVS